MTAFHSLTPQQIEQVDFLFADSLFGTDPALFDYELRGATITGRVRLTRNETEANKRRVSVNVAVMDVPAWVMTDEKSRRTKREIRSLAQRIVERLITTESTVEVSHERY